MKSIKDIRRENLREIVDRYFDGKQIRLAEHMGIAQNLISRWLSPPTVKTHKAIGDAVARRIEIAAKKPQYWLDTDHVLAVAAGKDADNVVTEIDEVASHHLRTWMQANRELKSEKAVASAAGIAASTVNRVLRKESSISINNLEAIAKAFGRRGYELLIPPNDDSIIQYDHSVYAELPAEEKAKIQAFIEFVIAQHRSK